MSDIMRRVVTLFEVQGANQIRAAMGTMESGFASGRRRLDEMGRSSGYVNNQLRALGTTIRYAFAGTAIFGTLQMVRNLGQFQAQLGEIQAIATGPNGLPLLDQQIDSLGTSLIDVSNRTTQPLSDLETGVLSLYSTIGNVPPNEAAAMMDTISKTSIVAQSNIEDTTQALLGMIDAFGRGTSEIPKFGDEFYRVIQLSAGMSGHVYAQQLGRLSASATLSGFNPEQMGALAIGATRFGGSPATNMRGLAQLMTFVMNPTGGKTEAAFESIGLGRDVRNRLGGYQVLQRVLAAVNQRGLKGNPRGLTDDMISQLDEQFPNGAPNSAIGLSGQGANLLAQLFPRIEGRRIAAVLARLQTPNQVAGTPNQTISDYLNQVANGTENVDKAMERAMDYRRIVQAGNAMHNFGIEVGNALSPLLQMPARGITAAVTDFNKQRWGVGPVSGQQIELGAGALGIVGLLRVLSGGTRGAGSLLRGAGALSAGADVLTQHGRGNTPLEPLYVAVVWSAGRVGGSPPFFGGGLGGAAGEGEAAAAKAGRFSRFARAGARAFRFAGPAAMIGLPMMDVFMGGSSMGAQQHAVEKAASGNPLLHYLISQNKTTMRGMGGVEGVGFDNNPKFRLNAAEQRILDAFKAGKIDAAAAERRLRAVTTHEHFKEAGLKVVGRAEVTIHDDRTKKKVHVSMDMVPDFTQPAPQTKAKPKTYRGSN